MHVLKITKEDTTRAGGVEGMKSSDLPNFQPKLFSSDFAGGVALAGMRYPFASKHFQKLLQIGALVITVQEKPLSESTTVMKLHHLLPFLDKLDTLFIECEDHYAPGREDFENIVIKGVIKAWGNNQPVIVHCGEGRGRTHTIIASILLACGLFNLPNDLNKSVAEYIPQDRFIKQTKKNKELAALAKKLYYN